MKTAVKRRRVTASRAPVSTRASRKRDLLAVRLSFGTPVESSEHVVTDRRSDCEGYADCLQYAMVRSWENFDCSKCADFRQSDALHDAAREIGRSLVTQRRAEVG